MTRHQFLTTLPRRATILTAALAGSLVLAACQREDAPATAGAAAGDTMAGMPGMAGMDHGAVQGGMESGGMMDQMQAHMRAMDGAGADSMRAMVPMHRQMVANMVAQFNREMRDMSMQTDVGWDATVDSLRRDLVRLPELSAGEVQAFMPAHRDRVMRLMEMHRSMMQNMGSGER